MDMNTTSRDPKDILNWVRRIVDDRLASNDLMMDLDGAAEFDRVWDRATRTVVRKPNWFPEGQAEMFRKVNLYADQVVLTTKTQNEPKVGAVQVADATRAFAEYNRSPLCPTAADTTVRVDRET